VIWLIIVLNFFKKEMNKRLKLQQFPKYLKKILDEISTPLIYIILNIINFKSILLFPKPTFKNYHPFMDESLNYLKFIF